MIEGKKILLGVTGSIAAYKSVYLVRLLVQSGAEVRVVMSPGALDFVTPLTFSTLSKNPVHSDFTENKDNGVWNSHVEMALWADLMVIAPLSANTLSKMAIGQCDNFLLAVYMSTRCTVMLAPAMDADMFLHQATQENLRKLQGFGHKVLAPNDGELASGLYGKGRMAEPDEILAAIIEFFNPNLPLTGKKALVTAGPTYELLDPVRFIGNFSSGKMGIAIANELVKQGAIVTLVCGPSTGISVLPGIQFISVLSANDMMEACNKIFDECDVAVMAAAVADYRPVTTELEKIKKNQTTWSLHLEKTVDIAATLGYRKRKDQVFVGFALETQNENENALIKLEKKGFDLLVLNSLRDKGAGFGSDTNKITLFWPGNKTKEFGLKSKSLVAQDIVTEIVSLIKQ